METTRKETRRVLLDGCKAHRAETVVVRKDDLRHALGQATADEWIAKAGKTKGLAKLVGFDRLKLIHIFETSPDLGDD